MANAIRLELETYRRKTGVPAVIGAVTDADETLALEVVGQRSRSGERGEATAEDLWHIGSCAKSITALLYARLVELGRAEWGTHVADLFGDLDVVDDGWKASTIDDLLRCRGGVRPNPSAREMRA